MISPVILKVEVESKVPYMIKVKIQMSVENNEKKNVNVTYLPYCENVFQNDIRSTAHLIKIDPTKEGWGDISFSFSAKRP